jgi:hypothetical protein
MCPHGRGSARYFLRASPRRTGRLDDDEADGTEFGSASARRAESRPGITEDLSGNRRQTATAKRASIRRPINGRRARSARPPLRRPDARSPLSTRRASPCLPGIWTICEHRLNTPASVTTCTRPGPMDNGRPARRGCASSNEPASRQKHVFAPPRHRSGALALRATTRRLRTETPGRSGPPRRQRARREGDPPLAVPRSGDIAARRVRPPRVAGAASPRRPPRSGG